MTRGGRVDWGNVALKAIGVFIGAVLLFITSALAWAGGPALLLAYWTLLAVSVAVAYAHEAGHLSGL